ncbi:hypothetical protein C791_3302 [Amycolatopsis azurea DSM 43854]|uniref:Uncharacterized protein n=1 Tax=Amycolatopsis azurea DSM 43854 TaxID=1238180 RepID=M2QL96_9PSEU|nr:hypothetical protein C791_3302 [Amycolatopsis azurea DSM 43854]
MMAAAKVVTQARWAAVMEALFTAALRGEKRQVRREQRVDQAPRYL